MLSAKISHSLRLQYLTLGLLIAAAFLGNYWNAPMFFGVDFLFGSIATLLIVAVYGTKWGLASALIGGSYTYIIWHHPYAAAILTFEAAFVGLLLRHFRGSLILAASTFWLLIGGPLVLFLYSVLLNVEFSSAVVVALKQATNGIFNATIAGLILLYSPISRVAGRLPPPTLFQIVLNLVLASVFLPSLLIMGVYGNGMLARIERDLMIKIDSAGAGLSSHIDVWLSSQLQIVKELADSAAAVGLQPSPLLQALTRQTANSSNNFVNAYVADRSGITLAFHPPKNERGESTLGLDFSDRMYFKVMKETLKPFTSEVFQGRGGVFAPIVTISVPVVENGRFEGYALAALNLSATKAMLERFAGDNQITLVNEHGLVVASTRPELAPMSVFAETAHSPYGEAGYFYRYPETPSPTIMSHWRDSFFGKKIVVSDDNRWKLFIETPIAPHQAYLTDQYIQSLSTLLLIFFVAGFAAILFARQLTLPINRLAQVTTGLQDRMQNFSDFRIPEGRIAEVNHLVNNFSSMAVALRIKFNELQETAAKLSNANSTLSQEIEERKRVEAELRLSSRLKDEFLATVSHELRTPLNIINGYIDIMETDGLDEESPDLIKIVSRNSKHLTWLIEDLLDISRIINGKITLQKKTSSLLDLARESVEAVKILEKSGNRKFSLEPDESLPLVNVDPMRIRQVLDNLLSNSIKFTPENGHIEVILRNLGKNVEIEVKDNGEGVAPEFLDQMFRRFMQEDGSSNRSHGGLGIGLAIVQEIVLLHGGEVTAKSPGKNRGTSIVITLPIDGK